MAGNISKYFYAAVVNKTCANFHHPGKTCIQGAVECMKNGFFGAMKFYLPLNLLPLLFKIKQWNEIKIWKEFLKNYSRCIFSGFFITTTGFVLFCISYHVFKGYYLPLAICLPSSLGAVFCGLLPKKFLHIDGLALLNIYLEFLIKQSKVKAVMWLRQSIVGSTTIYAVMNSIIIYCLYALKSNRFWLVNIGRVDDIKSDEMEGKSSCYHGDINCADYLKKDVTQTSAFALAISIFKLLFPRITKIIRNPRLIFSKYWKKFDYSLFLFIFASNAIFKCTFCKLNQLGKFSKEINCLIAGMLSSFGYVFYPRYIIFTMGISTAAEMLYKYINNYYVINNLELPKLMSIINRLPISELIYIFSIGMTFQLRVIYPHLTNKFIHKMMTIGTGGKSDLVAENFAGIIMGLQ